MSHDHQPGAGPEQAGRRAFLRRSSSLAWALGAGSLGSLLLAPGSVNAQQYRALVCVFLYGGNDGTNCVVPVDSRYAAYASVRGPLALSSGVLRPLAGSPFALHPALDALLPFWNQQQLAPVFNVGPLVRPLTRAQYLALPPSSTELPEGLFSHAEQQALWETGVARSGVRTGWGGRGSEQLATTNPVISLGGNASFGLEALRGPLVLPGPGDLFGAHGLQPTDLQWVPNRLRMEALNAMYAGTPESALAGAFMSQQRDAFEASTRLARLVASRPGDPDAVPAIDNAFAPLISGNTLGSRLARQLYQTAKLIHGRATVQGNRQIFFVEQGGYDTHLGQVAGSAHTGTHAMLLQELAQAMAAFQRAMNALGLAQQVTLFTQSDFGRTFVPNASQGTDHAWGNHQFVMGGAVLGGQTHGRYPELVLGGPDDIGLHSWEMQGRWLPSAGVAQYAATLLRWFGLDETQLDTVLPELSAFGSARSMGFLS